MRVCLAARRSRAACVSVVSLGFAVGLAAAGPSAASIFGPPPASPLNSVEAHVLNVNTGQQADSATSSPAPAEAHASASPSAQGATPFSNPLLTSASASSHLQGTAGAPANTGLSVSVSGASLNPSVDAQGSHHTTTVITARAAASDIVTIQAGNGLNDGDVVTLHEIMQLTGSGPVPLPAPFDFLIQDNASQFRGDIGLTFGSSTGAFGGVAGDTTLKVAGDSFGFTSDNVIEDPDVVLAPSTLEFTQDMVVGQATAVVFGLQLVETLVGDNIEAPFPVSGLEGVLNFDLSVDGTGFVTTQEGATTDRASVRSVSGFNYLAHNGADGVPEPAAWVLLILGFAGVGAMARLRGAPRTA